MRPTKIQREALDRQEAVWLAAVEGGEHTTTTLAVMLGLSPSWVRERVARARRSRPESPCSSSGDSIPRLALCQSSNPRQCCHSRRSTSSEAQPVTCLDCDASSPDGGRTWYAADDPAMPKLTVLVPHGHGLRRERIEPRPWQTPPDPPGPTSYRPSEGLKGGKGRTRRAGSTDRTS